jgi:phage terminase large subunit-like protein
LSYQQYIDSVQDGTRIAGRCELRMIERHVEDLKAGLFYFDEAEASRVVSLIRMLRHTKGALAGQHFGLQPFQEFILVSVFAWKRADGTRRFRRCYVEIARKNGKTEFAAAVGAIMAFFDGEAGAETYSAATTKDQAKLVFDASTSMVKSLMKDSASFKQATKVYAKSITGPGGGAIKYVSSDFDTLDGLNPSCAIIDEYHEHKTNGILQVMQTGMGSRHEPLLFVITTAGFNLESPCYRLRKVCIDILEGRLQDDSQFAAIYALDDDDDWQDPTSWHKANPNLGLTPTMEFMESQLQAAINEGYTAQTQFRTKNLNQWMRASKVWIDHHVYMGNAATYTLEDMKGLHCYGGLDMAATTDLCAFSLFFPAQEGLPVPRFLTWYWLPEETAHMRKLQDGVSYPEWAANGHIYLTSGNVADYVQVATDIIDIVAQVRMHSMAYDRAYAIQTVLLIQDSGIAITPFGQGFISMSLPTKEYERMIVGGQMQHNSDPVKAWMMGNVEIMKDAAGNIKPDKKKSKEKIDGIVSDIEALGLYMQHQAEQSKNPIRTSVYATRGARIV